MTPDGRNGGFHQGIGDTSNGSSILAAAQSAAECAQLGLYLTPTGTARLAKAGSAAAGIEREMLAGLSPRDQERFRELIFRCVAHLSAGNEERAS